MTRPFGATLTPRDLDVLRLAATGSTHAQTAARLGIGESSAVALMDDYRPGWRPRLAFPAHPAIAERGSGRDERPSGYRVGT